VDGEAGRSGVDRHDRRGGQPAALEPPDFVLLEEEDVDDDEPDDEDSLADDEDESLDDDDEESFDDDDAGSLADVEPFDEPFDEARLSVR
jgi:hypothetical protein